MIKKFFALVLCAAISLTFSACSQSAANLADDITGLIPNDVEAVIAKILGTDTSYDDGEHEFELSEGYVNMLKNGGYHIVYHLDDGTEVEYGYNGVRYGTSYPEPDEINDTTELQYDENGNVIPSSIPHEHIVLFEGIYYYIDDNQSKMFTVNPAEYKAVPFEICTEEITFDSVGNEDFGGKKCRAEKYRTAEGSITFYYENLILQGIVFSGKENVTLNNITEFSKYLSSSLVSMPSTYEIVEYWKAE